MGESLGLNPITSGCEFVGMVQRKLVNSIIRPSSWGARKLEACVGLGRKRVQHPKKERLAEEEMNINEQNMR